jgi:hypothetical protein
MAESEEGMDFLGAFKERFAARENTQARVKAERRAGMTPKQRERIKGPPKQQINFRATAETKALIEKVAERLDKSITDVIELAVRDLAAKTLTGKKS